MSLILLTALGIRLLGVSRGLPYIHEWDEPVVLSYVIGMLQRGDLNPGAFVYPSVYYYMLLPVMRLHYWYLHARGVLASPWQIVLYQPEVPNNAYWWYMSPASFYLWARTLTCLLGAATVYVVYRIGKTAYGGVVGLVAAALLAVAPGAVYYSDTVRTDIPMTFLLTCTVLIGFRIIRQGRWQDYVVAGLLAGVTFSTKTNGGLVAATLVVAHLLSTRPHRLVDGRLIGMGASAVAGAIVGSPFAILVPPGVLNLLLGHFHFYGPMSVGAVKHSLPQYLTYLVEPSQFGLWFMIPHTAFGALPVAAALWGLVAGFRGHRRYHGYLLSFPLLYLVFMSAHEYSSPQSLMPVLPFVALFAGVAWVDLWRRLQLWRPAAQSAWARAGAVAILLLLIAVPAREAVALGWSMGHHPDTRSAALEWLIQHVTPGARVALEDDLRWYMPDVYRLPFALRFAPPNASAAWYREQAIDYAVIERRNPFASGSAPTVAVFPSPAYEHGTPEMAGAGTDFPVINPALAIVTPITPASGTVFPVTVSAADTYREPVVTHAAGVYSQTVHLPQQRFPPGAYVVNVVTEPWAAFWPGSDRLTRLTAAVKVGARTIGTVTVAETPLRYTVPAFRIDQAENAPVELQFTFHTAPSGAAQPRPMQREWALRPGAAACATVPDSGSLNVQRLTVEAWVYPERLNAPPGGMRPGLESEAPILSKSKPVGYYLRLVGDAAGRVFADLSAAGKFSAGRAGAVPLRTWTHIAATYDGHEARIFLNGIPAAPERSPHYDGTIRADGAPLTIGCRDFGTPDQSLFQGLIADVRVWNRVLSLDEIRSEAGLRWLPDTSPGLAGSWAFRSSAPRTIPDLSGRGNDLDAHNLALAPVTTGPLARPEWVSTRRSFLRTVEIARAGP